MFYAHVEINVSPRCHNVRGLHSLGFIMIISEAFLVVCDSLLLICSYVMEVPLSREGNSAFSLIRAVASTYTIFNKAKSFSQ